MTAKAKTVKETAVDNHTYKIFPNDLNSYDVVFGGLVMAICDRITLVVAERHSERTCVTVSVDSMHFLEPAERGDILLFSASVNRSWHTSMEIGVKVDAENSKTREKRHIVSAYFTFVALNEKKEPSPVPAVIPESRIEKRRFEEAELRRQRRKEMVKELKERRAQEKI
ncbi:MAG: acyl-CoA thioesterase [Chlamydiae bacterium]|nr:acyl-CoA thioesterase [Chlamydiota bacterium]